MLKRPLLIYAALVFYTVGPFLPMLLASAVAFHYGCQLNEAAVHPCTVFGSDIGGALSTMFISAWLVLFTLPSGALAILIYSVYRLLRKTRGKTLPPSL